MTIKGERPLQAPLDVHRDNALTLGLSMIFGYKFWVRPDHLISGFLCEQELANQDKVDMTYTRLNSAMGNEKVNKVSVSVGMY